MSKKSCPVSYSSLLYKMDQDFPDRKYTNLKQIWLLINPSSLTRTLKKNLTSSLHFARWRPRVPGVEVVSQRLKYIKHVISRSLYSLHHYICHLNTLFFAILLVKKKPRLIWTWILILLQKTGSSQIFWRHGYV